MKNDKTLHESFEEELTNISKNNVLDSKYRKKKLILWTIRTFILLIIYMIFWKHEWVRKSLYFTIPLNLLSLSTIIVTPFLIKRKIQKTEQKIHEADRIIKESGEIERNSL